MSDPNPTPRTDAESYEYTPERSGVDKFRGNFPDSEEVVSANFAREIEYEIGEANKRIAELERSLALAMDAAAKGDEARRNAGAMEARITELEGNLARANAHLSGEAQRLVNLA